MDLGMQMAISTSHGRVMVHKVASIHLMRSVISLVGWVEWVDLEDQTQMLQDQERTYCLC